MRCYFKLLMRSVDDQSMREALRQFEFHIRTRNLSPKTISVYGERLGYFQRHLQEQHIPFEAVTKLTIQAYILSLKERGLADISINGQIKVQKIFFKFLKEEGLIETDPTEKIKLLKTEKRFKPILSEDDVERLLTIPDRKSFTGMRNLCMLLVFYDTLVRLSELINLKLSDLNLAGC